MYIYPPIWLIPLVMQKLEAYRHHGLLIPPLGPDRTLVADDPATLPATQARKMDPHEILKNAFWHSPNVFTNKYLCNVGNVSNTHCIAARSRPQCQGQSSGTTWPPRSWEGGRYEETPSVSSPLPPYTKEGRYLWFPPKSWGGGTPGGTLVTQVGPLAPC